MTWSLGFPNFLVGLREGLEAGLVVTILVGAVRLLAIHRDVPRAATAPLPGDYTGYWIAYVQ